MVYTSFASVIVWLMSAATLFAQDSLVQADTPRTTTTAQGSAALTASASQKIFLALKSSDLDSFKTLLAAGADPNARDPKSGRTLLMIADKAAAVKLLLAYGADPTLQDRWCRKPKNRKVQD